MLNNLPQLHLKLIQTVIQKTAEATADLIDKKLQIKLQRPQ